MELKLRYKGLLNETAEHLEVSNLGFNVKHNINAVISFPSKPFFTRSILASLLNDFGERQPS
jgi:hypothetical protein